MNEPAIVPGPDWINSYEKKNQLYPSEPLTFAFNEKPLQMVLPPTAYKRMKEKKAPKKPSRADCEFSMCSGTETSTTLNCLENIKLH